MTAIGTHTPAAPRVGAYTAITRLPWGLFLAIAFAVLLLVAVATPGIITAHAPTDIDYGAALHAPSPAHPFGTDESGRDLYTRVVWGRGTR